MKNIITPLLKIIAIFSAVIMMSNYAGATHVAGGYFQFECTGTPGVYTIRLYLYRDCSGINLPNNLQINLQNNCPGINNFNVTLTRGQTTEVSQICGQQINNTTCNGGNLPGYQEVVYTATVNLAACDTWTIGYRLCCRNTTNNVPNQPDFFVSSQLNTATNNCNTTPTVTAQPEPFVCVNQPVTYNLGASEPDGHTLSYSLVQAQTNFGTNAGYTNPHTPGTPIPGITIDPVTGTVNFTPNQIGAWIIVIRIEEYDGDGNLVSVTNYEYQTYVLNCSNLIPQPPAGGLSNVTGSVIQNGPNSLTMCQGFEGCFDVVFTDPDVNDILTVQSNMATVLPGATISQVGTNPLTVSVCWTPVTTSGNVTLSFLVEDNACPIVGQNNYAASINVVNPGVPAVVTTTELCEGTNEGTATITMTGGVPPFTYDIDGPVTGSNATGFFDNLPPGTYNYTVNSDIGCDLNSTFTIVPGPVFPVVATAVDALCEGACNGSATATPQGGTAPFVYVWSQNGNPIGQNTQTASNLCAGTYSVTVYDSGGCETTIDVTVNEPTAIAGDLTPTMTLCNDDCSGQVEVINVNGGTAPYEYNINAGTFQTGNTFNGLCAGAQQVVIRDDNNCLLTLNTTVTEPAPVVVVVTNTTPATCGSNNGTVTVEGQGGTAPYTYTLNAVTQAGATFTDLAPGSHVITVTDANGCQSNVTANITTVTAPTAFVDSQNNLSCAGGVNGSVLIGNVGAVAPITYSLNGGAPQASNSFTGLAAGAYTVDIVDGNGCVASTNFTITSPTLLTFNSTPTAASCNGVCDGQIQINVNGGTAPFQYSSNNGMSYSPNSLIQNLCAGNTEIVVQDANGCLSNAIVVIAQPTPLAATYTNVDPICNGSCDGSVTVNASGGTAPYLYAVNGGANQANSDLTGLCAGNQNVMVTDANGCELVSTQVLVNPPSHVINLISMTESNCGFNNGVLEVEAAGLNPPFLYSLNGGPNQTSGLYTNMLAGAYEIVATDALGCQVSTFFGINDIEMDGILLDQTPTSCFGGDDGTVEVINLAGAEPITFELDNSGTTQTNGYFGGLMAGSHIVTIYDAGFCIFTVPFTILEPDLITFDNQVTNILCDGAATGEIDFINITGGVGSYTHSIDGGFVFQPGTNFNSLTAGSYNLAVMDDNWCVVYDAVTITQATPVEAIISVFDLTCNANNTGLIQFIASGGTAPYTYSIDNGVTFQGSNSFVGLSAGTYNCVVRDVNNCTTDYIVTVNEPALLTANYTPTDALCNGSCDGQINIAALGGTTPYQYSIDNGVTYVTNPIINGVCAANYTVLVRDVNNCTTNGPVTIGQPTVMVFTTIEDPSICGLPNGQITVTPNGGTPAYTYSIDNGVTFGSGDIFPGLAEGNYNIQVLDANNCLTTGTQVVTNQPSPVINFMTPTHPLCDGSADGQITVSASGGTGVLTYSIDGGPQQASNVFGGLVAGTYSLMVTDENGCTDTENITLNNPPVLAFTSTSNPLTCFQNSTGSISVTPSGGTPPYQYSFDNGTSYGSSPVLSFISAGTYNIVVRDFNGCEIGNTQTVTEPTQLVFDDIASVDALCNSYCDGSISLTITGGTAPYSYNWLQGVAGNVNTAIDLCTGNYNFIVTDANGCSITDDVFINEPDSVEINQLIKTDVLCHGNCDGTITIIANTGDQYSIDGGTSYHATNNFTGLCNDTYDIVVLDATGCSVEDQIYIWQADPLQLEIRSDTTLCYGVQDTLFAIGSGGIQPYTYLWSDGSTDDFNEIIQTQSGTYTVQLFDFNGCTLPTESTNVTVIPLLEANTSADVTICPGAVAALSGNGVDGLPAYDYLWSTGETSTNIIVAPQTSPTEYILTVTDQCGHTAQDTVVVSYFIVDPVSFTTDVVDGCSPLVVEFTNTTGANQAGSTCTWYINGVTYNTCNGPTHTFVNPGCYDISLYVTSADGCDGSAILDDLVCVYPNPVASFTHNPFKPTLINNQINFYDQSVGADNYFWDFDGFGSSTNQNPSVTFTGIQVQQSVDVCLNVSSDYGCVDSICTSIVFGDDFAMYVPNAFTPDFDQHNPVFLPIFPPTIDIIDYNLLIFNRWGEILFESYNYKVGWDGTFGGKIVQDGVYIWQIKVVEGEARTTRDMRGHVTLIR